MGAFKSRRNYNTFFNKKSRWDLGKYYRQGSRYHDSSTIGLLYKSDMGSFKQMLCRIHAYAINKWEFDKEIMYAKRIQKLQKELGLEVSDFECLS